MRQPWWKTKRSEPDQELEDRLRKHVDVLAELIGPRHLGRPAALRAAAGYLEQQLPEKSALSLAQ